eukprot:4720241-Prymnesium_polylepis.1
MVLAISYGSQTHSETIAQPTSAGEPPARRAKLTSGAMVASYAVSRSGAKMAASSTAFAASASESA